MFSRFLSLAGALDNHFFIHAEYLTPIFNIGGTIIYRGRYSCMGA
jgi:hypothetical protein